MRLRSRRIRRGAAVRERAGRRGAAGVIALIERPSQLEKRINIMTAAAHRFRKSIALAAVALGVACLFGATTSRRARAMTAAQPTPWAARAESSAGTSTNCSRSEPGIAGAGRDGTPMVVKLLNETGARAARRRSRPRCGERSTNGSSACVGLSRDAVPYVGTTAMQSPTNPVLEAAHGLHGKSQARQAFRLAFSSPTTAQSIGNLSSSFHAGGEKRWPAGLQPWVLLDREGHVLRSGQEQVVPAEFHRTLATRFPGINTRVSP